jgi:hypothetical protein
MSSATLWNSANPKKLTSPITPAKSNDAGLILKGKIDEHEGKEIEIRTLGSKNDFKSYCYVLYKGAGYGAVELEAYGDEMDAREGHLRWLLKRDRCLSYLEALGIIRRGRRLFD